MLGNQCHCGATEVARCAQGCLISGRADAGSGFMNLSGFKTQDNAWAKLLEGGGAGSKGGSGREGTGQRDQ